MVTVVIDDGGWLDWTYESPRHQALCSSHEVTTYVLIVIYLFNNEHVVIPLKNSSCFGVATVLTMTIGCHTASSHH